MGFSAEKALKILGSGLLVVGGPQLIEGMMGEYIKKIKIKDAQDWIIHGKSLWENIPPEWQLQLKKYGNRMGDLKFLTTEWVMTTARQSNPGLVSLFLNWPEALEWFDQELKDLVAHIKGEPEG